MLQALTHLVKNPCRQINFEIRFIFLNFCEIIEYEKCTLSIVVEAVVVVVVAVVVVAVVVVEAVVVVVEVLHHFYRYETRAHLF